jgi:uncharacterized membrane protein
VRTRPRIKPAAQSFFSGSLAWHFSAYFQEQFQSIQCGMSATSFYHPSIADPAAGSAVRSLRFGVASVDGEPTVQWLLKRNCSSTPGQLGVFFASLCALSLAIGAFCWFLGATLVMPFAWLELFAVGTALVIYARHATDRERIRLQAGRVSVEHVSGRRTERVEFAPAWVRVEPVHGDRSLVELSGEGRRIVVGRFVRPELRRQLADELRWALRRWQGLPVPRSAGCVDGAQQHTFEN